MKGFQARPVGDVHKDTPIALYTSPHCPGIAYEEELFI